jgi:hypothetical protein
VEQVIRDAEASPFGLIRGTNWENAGNRNEGPCYALSTNVGAHQVLLKAAQLAEEWGDPAKAKRWRNYAGRIRREVLERLVFKEDTPHNEAYTFPKGTWMYGLNRQGKRFLDPLCGWMWGGSTGTGLYGMIDRDLEMREIYTRTAGAGRPLYKTQPRGFLIGYGRSYEGADTMFTTVALSDEPSYMSELVEMKMTGGMDYRQDLGSRVAELSRWALGSGRGVEDTNLVGAAAFIAMTRFMAGVDDLLYEDTQLQVVPRLIPGWDTLTVNDWRVRYRNQEDPAWTRLSFEYHRGSEDRFTVSTAEAVKGFRVRLGVFPGETSGFSATLEGEPIQTETEVSGEGKWVWVTLDTGPAPQKLVVRRSKASLPH